MSATTYAGPTNVSGSWTHSARLVLVALAIVVLLTVSFVIGRATTATTTKLVPVTAPTAVAHTTAPTCRMGRPC